MPRSAFSTAAPTTNEVGKWPFSVEVVHRPLANVGVEFPKFWSQTATNIVAQKYFRGRVWGHPNTGSRRPAAVQRLSRGSCPGPETRCLSRLPGAVGPGPYRLTGLKKHKAHRLPPEGFVEIVVGRRGWVNLDGRILPMPSDGMGKERVVTTTQEPEKPPTTRLFTVTTEICGDVVLTSTTWENHICKFHPELAPHLDYVRLTLEEPNLIYETPYKKPTYAFYKRELLTDIPRFRECYVAVFVRHSVEPAQVCTAYFPTHLSENAGRLLRLRR